MPTILVADDQADIRDLVEVTLLRRGYQVVVAESGTAALELSENTPLDLAILDVNMPGLEGTHVARVLRSRPATANVPIMLLTALAGEADTLAGFAAGADDYVTKPFNPRELAARVQALLARGSAGSAPAARPQGQLIAVAGTKGGCGRTTVAVNVALALNAAARSGRSGPGQGAVVLLDGHLTQGDVDVHLDLRSTTTMRELVPYAGRLDVAAVERTLVLHTSGLKVLLRPRGLGQAELITTSLWQEILQISTAIGEQVVVDLGPGVDDERSLAAWEHASAILLVVTPEISAVRDGRQLLENAERLGIERSRIRIILNRSHNHANLSAKDVAGALGVEQRSLLELPDVGAAAVGRVNRGTPVVLAEPGSALARGLEHLALSLTVRA